jgi:two-component system LytT family response regulator
MIKNKLKAIIVDDNKQSIKVLENFIDKCFGNRINIENSYNNPLKAFQYLENNIVDIVFIDVQMPNMTGIEFIELMNKNTKTYYIVISSFEEFALKALKLNVFDYLTKPIDITEFKNTIERLLSKIDQEEYDVFHNPNQIEKKILVHTHEKTLFLEVNKILRIESDGSYCIFYTEGDEKKCYASKNLKFFEEKLMNNSFFRLNRSNIVNVSKIVEIQKSFGDGIIVFSDDSKMNISRADKGELLKYMKNQTQLFFD